MFVGEVLGVGESAGNVDEGARDGYANDRYEGFGHARGGVAKDVLRPPGGVSPPLELSMSRGRGADSGGWGEGARGQGQDRRQMRTVAAQPSRLSSPGGSGSEWGGGRLGGGVGGRGMWSPTRRMEEVWPAIEAAIASVGEGGWMGVGMGGMWRVWKVLNVVWLVWKVLKVVWLPCCLQPLASARIRAAIACMMM